MSSLSVDPVYQQERERLLSARPLLVWHGVWQGVCSVALGGQHAVIGLVREPVRSVRQQGVLKGVLSGMTKGITGLATKPLTGLMDLFSKTAEGLMSTATFLDDKPSNLKQRSPRVVYGHDQYIQDYCPIDSSFCDFYRRLEPQKYHSLMLLGVFYLEYEPDPDFHYQLAVFQEKTFMLHLRTRKVLWKLNMADLHSVSRVHEGVKLKLKRSVQENPLVIYISDSALCESVVSLFNSALL